MSGTDETELNRIREEYGDLMNEEDRAHFPTAQEQAKKRVEERREREKQEERTRFISELFYHGQSFQRWQRQSQRLCKPPNRCKMRASIWRF